MSDPVGACARFWSTMRDVVSALPPLVPPSSGGTGIPPLDEHGDDPPAAEPASTQAQDASQAATNAGGDGDPNETTGSCPLCKVAIVVGHNGTAKGAYSSYIGQYEYPYNSDIAERTVTKIEAGSEGKISAKVFFRTPGENQLSRAYAPVHTYLEGVPTNKKIALELHFNAIGSGHADYALTIYNGNRDFAVRATTAMAAVYGVSREVVKHYLDNPRGQATFRSGPANTYLMEPFFGTDERTSNIAKTEAGRDALAQAYADLLIEWVG